jgi:hypothetical protein
MIKDAGTVGCPSGCPRTQFPREAAIFYPLSPHITVAWSGDKIDKVPVPLSHSGFARSGPLRLTSDEILSLIRDFLTSKGAVLPGLALRIHSRDPITEYVIFRTHF